MVAAHDFVTGLVELHSINPHPALRDWDNVLVLQPFTIEDVLTAINGVRRLREPKVMRPFPYAALRNFRVHAL